MKKVSGNECPEFRVSFPNVFKPKAFQPGQDAKYSIVMLFPKKTNLAVFKRAVDNAAIEKWGENKAKWPKLRLPFRDGNEFQDRKGYKDHIFISASAKDKPGVVDQKRDRIDPETGDQIFYAGCYARASLIAFAYDNMGNRGVGFALQNIQKLRDGEKFSGRKDAEDEFDSVEDGSEDESNYGDKATDSDDDDTNPGF